MHEIHVLEPGTALHRQIVGQIWADEHTQAIMWQESEGHVDELDGMRITAALVPLGGGHTGVARYDIAAWCADGPGDSELWKCSNHYHFPDYRDPYPMAGEVYADVVRRRQELLIAQGRACEAYLYEGAEQALADLGWQPATGPDDSGTSSVGPYRHDWRRWTWTP